MQLKLTARENHISQIEGVLELKNCQITDLKSQIQILEERRQSDNQMHLNRISDATRLCLSLYQQLASYEGQLKLGQKTQK